MSAAELRDEAALHFARWVELGDMRELKAVWSLEDEARAIESPLTQKSGA